MLAVGQDREHATNVDYYKRHNITKFKEREVGMIWKCYRAVVVDNPGWEMDLKVKEEF